MSAADDRPMVRSYSGYMVTADAALCFLCGRYAVGSPTEQLVSAAEQAGLRKIVDPRERAAIAGKWHWGRVVQVGDALRLPSGIVPLLTAEDAQRTRLRLPCARCKTEIQGQGYAVAVKAVGQHKAA